jgi:hypothetical protein
MARAAGVSIGAPAATKSFCMSTTIMAAFAGSIVSTRIVASPLIGSNHNPLDLIEANLIAAAIIELRPARRRMVRHGCGHLD